jgi:hypothetical protein
VDALPLAKLTTASSYIFVVWIQNVVGAELFCELLATVRHFRYNDLSCSACNKRLDDSEANRAASENKSGIPWLERR